MAATITYTYQWYRNSGGTATPITGATQSSYVLVTADENCTITCKVTAIDSAGSTIATTAPTATITPATTLSTPVLPAVPTPNSVPSKINKSFSSSGQPSPYISVGSAKYMNIFPAGTSPVLTLSASGATNWTCKDIYNNTSTGTVSGTSLTPTPPAGGSSWPCGWYRVTLTNSGQNIATWGQQCGDGSFQIMNDGVSGLPGPTQFPNGVAYSDASYGTWVPPLSTACGTVPSRWSITNTASPTSGTTDADPYDGENTTSMTEMLTYDANWFMAYGTTNRPHQEIISWPNGTVDVVNVLTNSVLTTLGSGAAFTLLVRSNATVYVTSTTAGTVNIATTSGGSAVETWTGTTWSALVSAINAGSKYVVAYSSSPSSNATTFAQATIVNTSFNAIASVVSAVSAKATSLGVVCPAFEGPYNEPDNDPILCAAQMVAFKAACVSAFSGAIVLGPMPVTVDTALIGWITNFFAACKTIGYIPNGFSFHMYNVVNGDMEMADQTLSAFRTALNNAGFGSVPLWMTEGDATFINNYGAISWRNFTHWMAMRMLMLEAYGFPIERQVQYYMSNFGYTSVPSYLKNFAHQTPTAAPIFQMWRGFIERTANATAPTRLTMPTAAAHLFLGLIYSNPTNEVITLMTAGQPTGTVTLSFSSPVANTIYDWAGNTVSTSTGATSTVTVSDLPTYVVVPTGTTVTVIDANNGLGSLTTNLASTATISSSVPPTTNTSIGTPGAASTLINGKFECGMYITDGGGGPAEYRSNVAPPVWFVLEWTQLYSINRVLLFSSPGWQDQDVPLQYNVYTWSGSAWILQSSYTNATASSAAIFTSNNTWQSFSEQYWDGAHNFDINLGGVSTNAVRIDILNVSYGSDPDNAAGSPNAGQNGPAVSLREIQVYGVTETTPAPPTFTADSPPTTATVGTAYSYQITATGATSFSETGSLPPGITVSSNGLISGTPTSAGTYSFTVSAISQYGTTVSPNLSITVSAVSTGRFIGYTMDVTNRGGMVGKNLTSTDAITPRTNFPGGSTAAANQNLPCNFESFTDYLAAFPWPAMIGCFMNDNDKYTPSGSSTPNISPLYFGAGAGTTTEINGYPTFQGQLTNPGALTGGPFVNSPYKNPGGSAASAAIPIISWDLGSTSLASIANGSQDASTIIPAALACKAWPASAGNPAYGTQSGGQVIIRLMHEFNGKWSGYCPGYTGQPSNTTTATFVSAWQHIVQVFANQGATNVRWHWCPNVFGSAAGTPNQSGWSTGSGTVALMYPGDAYVDYVGLDGYNYTNNSPNWQSFAQVFQNSYNGIYVGDSHTIIPGKSVAGPISAKPMILGEIGCWETDEMKNIPSTTPATTKGKWFTDMITTVTNSMPKIQGICYWYENPGAVGNQTSTEYYLTSSASSAAGWNTVANTWTGRPPVIQGVTAAL